MSTALGILAAEIVKKVIGGHGPNLHDCACACGLPVQRIEHPNLPLPLFFDFDAHRARGHDLYAIDGVTQHIITHAETKSGNWAKATCPNVIVERSEETE